MVAWSMMLRARMPCKNTLRFMTLSQASNPQRHNPPPPISPRAGCRGPRPWRGWRPCPWCWWRESCRYRLWALAWWRGWTPPWTLPPRPSRWTRTTATMWIVCVLRTIVYVNVNNSSNSAVAILVPDFAKIKRCVCDPCLSNQIHLHASSYYIKQLRAVAEIQKRRCLSMQSIYPNPIW